MSESVFAAAERLARVDERLSSYRGAQATRLDKPSPSARGASPDWTLEREYDRRDLVDRARQLERNSVLAEGMLSRSTEAVVGNGFGLQAKSADEVWNKDVEAKWKAWCESGADVRGLCSFGELLALVFRSFLRDGDVGAVLLSTGQIRVVESDEIASPTGYLRPNMVDGVELNESGRPIAYHVIRNPRVLAVDRRGLPNHTVVPAENVLFLARRRRAGQTRGVSAFAGVTWILDQIDGNIEAVTVAARMAACFGVVLKRKSRGAGLDTVTGADGIARRKLRVEPGSFFEVEPDEDVKQIQANQPTTNFPDFLNTLARVAAIPFGLPVEILMMNFEKTNYSNARAALLQAFKVWREHQGRLKAFCTRVYLWWLLRQIEAGEVSARADALEHGWLTPGWQWIDPQAEIQTTLAAIDSGLETRAQALMRLGFDPEEQYAQIRKEQPIAKELGLDVRSTLTRDKLPPPEAKPPGGGGSGPEGATSGPGERLRSDPTPPPVVHLHMAPQPTPPQAPAPKVEIMAHFHQAAPPAVDTTPMAQAVERLAEAVAPQPPAPVNVTVLPAPVVNEVTVQAAPAPVVNVTNEVDVKLPEPKPRHLTLDRDQSGKVTGGSIVPVPE